MEGKGLVSETFPVSSTNYKIFLLFLVGDFQSPRLIEILFLVNDFQSPRLIKILIFGGRWRRKELSRWSLLRQTSTGSLRITPPRFFFQLFHFCHFDLHRINYTTHVFNKLFDLIWILLWRIFSGLVSFVPDYQAGPWLYLRGGDLVQQHCFQVLSRKYDQGNSFRTQITRGLIYKKLRVTYWELNDNFNECTSIENHGLVEFSDDNDN